MAIFQDAQTDSADLATGMNEDTLFNTRYGPQPKKSFPMAIREIEETGDAAITNFNNDGDAAITAKKADFDSAIASKENEFDLTLEQYKESRGFNNKGNFSDGFTYELPNDVGLDVNGNPWVYNGALPFTVSAGTTPTSPTYTQVVYGNAAQVSTNTSDTTQSFIDSFALKIFQSPTDGGLTEIQTRTVNANAAYEVRKTSDDSLATIYSDAAGTTEIVQNGTDNKSGSDGVVEFYIADGDYYVEVGGVDGFFRVNKEEVISVNSISDFPAKSNLNNQSFVTLADGKYWYITESVNGLENTPDTIKINNNKFANRIGGYKTQRAGVYVTSKDLGHRVGDITYMKRTATSAELLTDLSDYKAYTTDDIDIMGLTVAYADWTKGNDNSGDGLSWSTAKASLASAVALNTDIVLVRSGVYNRVNRMSDFTVSKDRAIIGVGGQVITGVVASGQWSKTVGQNNVYQLDYASGLTNETNAVFDSSYLTNSAPTKMAKVNSVADVDSTLNSFYHDTVNFVTYVRTADDRDMTLSRNINSLKLLQPVSPPKFIYPGSYKLYLKNVEFWGGSGGAVSVISDGGNYTESVFYAENCKFNGNLDDNQNGLNVRDIGLVILDNCEASANRKDGFNYHAWLQGQAGVVGLNPHFVEINCQAHNNGLDGSEGNNQGSSSHEDCVGFRIGGDYSYHEDGGCIVDIEATKCYLVGLTCNYSAVVGALLASEAYPLGDPDSLGIWWIDGINCKNNPEVSNGMGDIAMDGYRARVHMSDTHTEKPISTRAFSSPPDSNFS